MPELTGEFFGDEPRREPSWQQFSEAPKVTVVGVVSPSGAGGTSDGQSTVWTLTFALAAWRIAGEGIQTTELTIRQRMTHDDLQAKMAVVHPYGVLGLKVRLVQNSVLGSPQGELIELLGRSADPELNQIAAKLQEPVSVADDRFGTLSLDRQVDRFEGRTSWQGESIRLMLEARGAGVCPDSLAAARTLFEKEGFWSGQVNDYAVKMLHGRTCLEEEDEVELSRDEFLSRMRLTTIAVSSDGQFEFWHDDGGLFWGHAIVVYGDLEKGPTGVDTPG